MDMLGNLLEDGVELPDARPSLRVVDARAKAFRQLVDGQLDAAYHVAAIILDDPIEAEDAVHDAALSAWRRFDQLREKDRFDAWFSRILVNQCRDRLRSWGRRRLVDLGGYVAAADHPRTPDSADATAIRDELSSAVNALPPDDRLIVSLRYGADLTVPAIARLVDIPEGTVKSRLHNALARLRRSLEE
jgi:RNA polymerase sigma-70 factor (ECF subfamily)